MFRTMANADSALVVISCPHCGTRYQLPWDAIGTKGRTVACAHCGQSWEAHATKPVAPDTRLTTLAEEELDARLVAAEQRERERRAAANRRAEPDARPADNVAVLPLKGKGGPRELAGETAAAAPAGADEDDALPPDLHRQTVVELVAASAKSPPAGKRPVPDSRRQQTDFSRRQQSLYDAMPRARARRLARYAALAAIVVVFGGGLLFRTELVTQFPQLAAPYAAIGLPVNVVGLRFTDVTTLQSLQSGVEVLVVDGSVQSVSSRALDVPRVIVTLLDRQGNSLYAWSVTPRASRLPPGAAAAFESRLTNPPGNAVDVRLSFGPGAGGGQPAVTPLDTGATPTAGGDKTKTDKTKIDDTQTDNTQTDNTSTDKTDRGQ